MDLLEGESKKNKKTKGQKIILGLLILSVILVIAIVVILFVLQNISGKNQYTITVNNRSILKEDIGLLELEDGHKYLSLRQLSNQLGYKYFNGEYNVVGENKDKGYINNEGNIAQFYANSNKIFKTVEDGEIDYEYYELKNIIIQENDTLYINVEDLDVGLNLIYSFSSQNNRMTILTPDFWIGLKKEEFSSKGYNISDSIENKKAIPYGLVIVENNKKYGVVNLAGQEIIGNKYNSVTFIENTLEFIVSNSYDKYGIINIKGATEIELQYDSIEVINYNPILYKVETLKQFGIMKKDGSILGEIKYKSIGYRQDKANNIKYTLIIPELNENIPKSIVVNYEGDYGLIDLEKGREIVPCTLEGIFLLVDVDRNLTYYAIKFNNGNLNTLENYVKALNQITVNVN